MGEDLLRVRDLKTYLYVAQGVLRAVDGVSLSVDKGAVVGLVGESGCGKTMTALSIMRLVRSPPAKIVGGEVLFKGKNLLELSEKSIREIRGAEISMVFQDPMTFLNPVFRIGDQIVETMLIHPKQGATSKEAAERKAVEMLELLNVPSPSNVVRQYPHQLSGGMRQRVVIAIALSCFPSLIIADEPTTALDATVQMQIIELIKEVQKKLNVSLLLITHNLGVVAEVCDKVYVMYAGKIVEVADTLSLFQDPKHPYTQGLLQSILDIQSSKDSIPYIEGRVPDLTNPPPGCRFLPRCLYAKPICRGKDPPSVNVKPHHEVSCWLW